MKAGWEIRPLGDLVEIKPPKREAKVRLAAEQPVSFVPMEDLKEVQRVFQPKQIRPLSEVYGGYTYFADRDVLLAKITPCFENGKLSIATGLANGVGFGSSEFMVLRCSPKIDPYYLFYFLSRDAFREEGKGRMTGAVGHKRVPPEFVQSQPIPLPPLDEQKRIVAVLDEAFEGLSRARANAEANIADARELFGAGVGSAFNAKKIVEEGGSLFRLGELADLNYGYTTKAHSEPTGPKFLRITDIQGGTVDWSRVPFCTEPPEDNERYRLIPGDIVFARTGATTGKSYLIWEDEDAVAASYLIRLRLRSPVVVPDFLALFFHSDAYWEEIKAGISGSTQGGFNASKLAELWIPVPSLDAQAATVERLQELKRSALGLDSCENQRLQLFDALRQSLLQKAFSGDLT